MCTRSIRYREETHGSSRLYCMRTAFAIGAWYPSEFISANWLKQMTWACIRSIRLAGHHEPVFVLTCDEEIERTIGQRDWTVLRCPLVKYPAVKHLVDLADAQKLHYWNVDCEKLIALDCDTIVRKSCSPLWKQPCLTGSFGDAPLNTGVMVLEPNKDTFDDLLHLVTTGFFDEQTGWNHCGRLEWKGTLREWNYVAVRGSQGYLYYYFHIQRRQLHYLNFYPYVDHFSGRRHRQEDTPEVRPYKEKIHSLIGHL